MTDFTVTVAGVSFRVQTRYGLLKKKCAEFLSDCEPKYEVSASDGEVEREKAASEAPVSCAYAESVAIFRKMSTLAAADGILLMHGSAFICNNKAVIITAPSGTGKSTHTALWRELYGDEISVINDDKPWLKRENGHFTVYGTPWMGKENRGSNISAPLYAICSLHRSETNRVAPCERGIETLLEQTFRPSDPGALKKVVGNLWELNRSVRMLDVFCNMEKEAAETVRNAIFGEKQ